MYLPGYQRCRTLLQRTGTRCNKFRFTHGKSYNQMNLEFLSLLLVYINVLISYTPDSENINPSRVSNYKTPWYFYMEIVLSSDSDLSCDGSLKITRILAIIHSKILLMTRVILYSTKNTLTPAFLFNLLSYQLNFIASIYAQNISNHSHKACIIKLSNFQLSGTQKPRRYIPWETP